MHMLMHMLGHDSAVPSVGHDFYHDEDDGSYECVECWEEHPPWMTCEDYEQEIAEERGGYYCGKIGGVG